MRGKLRDKRLANKKGKFNREGLERRHPYKRSSQPINWLNRDIEEDYDLEIAEDTLEDEETEVKKTKLSNKK